MGCGSGGCGTSTKGGAPGGCQSHGSCSTGGCNRMNVHDWLANLPFADPESDCRVVEVSFNQGSRKDFYRNATLQYFSKGEIIVVEGTNGFDIGEVSLTGELVRLQLKKRGVAETNADIKRILRGANDTDIIKWKESKAREKDIMIRSRAMAKQQNLNMKIGEVELQADGKKCTFFYIADDRVDFRELIRIYAGEFKVKVEMRQIGARQEAGKVGGIGSCGRELCCSTWLTDFKSVNTQAARYQNLSINQTKLSGQCGRLKCCLNYELDTYMDALQFFPENAEELQTTKGRAFLVKKDIFKNLMWYTTANSTNHYPLSLARVREIKELNAKGIAVEELQPVDIITKKEIEKEPEFVDVVGHITLRSLDKNNRGGNNRNQSGNRGGNDRGPQEQPPQHARPQQVDNRNQPQKSQQPSRPPIRPAQPAPVGIKPAVAQPQNRPPQQQPYRQQPQQNRPQQQRVPQQNTNNQGDKKPPQNNQPPQQRPPQQRSQQPQQRPLQQRPPQVNPNQAESKPVISTQNKSAPPSEAKD